MGGDGGCHLVALLGAEVGDGDIEAHGQHAGQPTVVQSRTGEMKTVLVNWASAAVVGALRR